MKSIFLSLVFSFLTVIAFAQFERATGMLLDASTDKAAMSIKRMPDDYTGEKYDDIPYEKSLREYCPYPGDQGMIGSCVGWACGFAGLTIEQAIKDKEKSRSNITNSAFSPSFIYNQVMVGPTCLNGSVIVDALELMKNKGTCYQKTFGYDKVKCDKKPTSLDLEEAEYFRIKDYASLFHYQIDNKQDVIDKTIRSIVNDKPVVIGMEIFESWLRMKPGQKVWKPIPEDKAVGGHAMVVVGYDEIEQRFELINSWGTGWGDRGFIYVSYEDYAKYVRYGFQIFVNDLKEFEDLTPDEKDLIVEIEPIKPTPRKIDDPKIIIDPKKDVPVIVDVDPMKPQPKNGDDLKKDEPNKEDIKYAELKGEFVFRYPVGYQKDANGNYIRDAKGNKVLNFVVARPKFTGIDYTYSLEQKQWKTGQLFQLVTKNVSEGKSIYVINLAPGNDVKVHWPKNNGKYTGEKYEDVDIADFLPSEDAEIVVPGSGRALKLEKGKDNLCVLYADKPIEDFFERVEKMNTSEGNFKDKLINNFGDLFVTEKGIKYQSDGMKFKTIFPEGEGTVVPLILTVEGI